MSKDMELRPCHGKHRMWPWRRLTKSGWIWVYPCCGERAK